MPGRPAPAAQHRGVIPAEGSVSQRSMLRACEQPDHLQWPKPAPPISSGSAQNFWLLVAVRRAARTTTLASWPTVCASVTAVYRRRRHFPLRPRASRSVWESARCGDRSTPAPTPIPPPCVDRFGAAQARAPNTGAVRHAGRCRPAQLDGKNWPTVRPYSTGLAPFGAVDTLLG